jgi:hypothetical protein
MHAIHPNACSPHERRRGVLADLAKLGGFLEDLRSLPDGSIPDVLRLDPWSGAVFLADAKDTETPGCAATAARLARYVEWFCSQPSPQRERSVMALCFGEAEQAAEWATVLSDLFAQAGFAVRRVGAHRVDAESVVLTLKLGRERCGA